MTLLRASLVAGTLAAVAAFASPALADRYRLTDGQEFEAAPVGEIPGVRIKGVRASGDVVFLLTYAGKEIRVAKAGIASVDSGAPLPKKLAPKLARAKRNFRAARRRAAAKLIRRYKRAKKAERLKIVAQLDAFPARTLEGPLSDALSDRKLRAFALERLAATKGAEGIRPLVKAVVTSKDKSLREQAHAAALGADKVLTRTYYEQIVAMPVSSKRRMRALGRLAGMGDRQAIPGLIFALEKVESEIQAVLATAGGLRRIPVNLGTRGGAAINAPIELPEQSTIAVQSKVTVSTLRQVSNAVRKVLGGLSGVERANSKSWQVWWDDQPTSYRK
ncbi:MAG: hypothetical protein JKY65_30825 [Planctomycetes bacterium]|nr:hypothetical protein [Planctomycetota bacterium]